MTLHTVSKSPLTSNALESCLRICQPGDSILLLEDGVYAASANIAPDSILSALDLVEKIYVLSEDVDARGIAGLLVPDVKTIDYEGFVELTCVHEKTVSWF